MLGMTVQKVTFATLVMPCTKSAPCPEIGDFWLCHLPRDVGCRWQGVELAPGCCISVYHFPPSSSLEKRSDLPRSVHIHESVGLDRVQADTHRQFQVGIKERSMAEQPDQVSPFS
jgi:hypothetical protein